MSKYVPSFLRGSTAAASVASVASVASASAAVPSAPSESAFRSFVREDPVVTNTSLPARTAVPLPPATLASLTITEKPVVETATAQPWQPMASTRAKRMPLPKEDDFPTLGGSKVAVAAAPSNAVMSFRDLATSWAEKQRVEAAEAVATREKERAAAVAAAVDAANRDNFRIIAARTQRVVDSDEEREKEREREEETPVEDTTEPSEDEEEADDWDDRKHDNDLW